MKQPPPSFHPQLLGPAEPRWERPLFSFARAWSLVRQGMALSFGLGLIALTGGCALVKSHYTLNPDGKGKVTVEMARGITPLNFNGESSEVSPESLWERVEKILEQTEGIEVWKDVSFALIELPEETYFVFRGTGYFQNLNEVKLAGINEIYQPRLELTNDVWHLQLLPFGQTGEPTDPEQETGTTLEADAHPWTAELKERASRRDLRLFQAILEETKHKITFTLPQVPLEKEGFAEIDLNIIQMSWDGADLARKIDLMEAQELIFRDTSLSALLDDSSPLALQDNQTILAEYLSTSWQTTASWEKVGYTHFDYEAEVEAALAHYPTMLETIRP